MELVLNKNQMKFATVVLIEKKNAKPATNGKEYKRKKAAEWNEAKEP